MKHTLAAAREVAARRSTTGPHAPYMLIVCALAEKINSGELKPGDRVPSVTELVGTHNVSPSTARRALAKLKEMSLTDTVPGYATFVRSADVQPARQTAERSSATGSAVRDDPGPGLRGHRMGADVSGLPGGSPSTYGSEGQGSMT
jgi:DNA-binding transcriptional regulator YhcF (GntR family)